MKPSPPSLVSPSPELLRLLELPGGSEATVVRLEGDDAFRNRLREMGLVESAIVRVLHVNGSVLCQVKDSRFGLSRTAAEGVLVKRG